MGLISLLFSNPVLFFALAVLLLYSVIAHEVAHGFTAYLFGDDTAKRSGRLSLNPIMHIDPVGLLMLFVAGFGWAKPVPVDYYSLKRSRAALICVSLSGCLTNILIAIIALFFIQFQNTADNRGLYVLLGILVRINIILGAFNLIPIPPLDGSKVLMAFLPHDAQTNLARIEPYGFFILIFLLFTGMLNPLINFMQGMVYGLIIMLFKLFR